MSKELQYTLTDQIRGVNVVREVGMLVAAGAFPGSGKQASDRDVQAESRSAWDALEQAGYVDRDGPSSFALTVAGVSNLRSVVVLKEPRRVCDPRPGLAICDRTSFEMMLALRDAQWEWKAFPPKKQDRDALTYKVGDPLIWYSMSNSPNKLYLQCLLQAEDLQLQGIEEIPHYSSKPAQVYGGILRGIRPAGHHQVALGNDVEGEEPLPRCDDEQLADLSEEGMSEIDIEDELERIFDEAVTPDDGHAAPDGGSATPVAGSPVADGSATPVAGPPVAGGSASPLVGSPVDDDDMFGDGLIGDIGGPPPPAALPIPPPPPLRPGGQAGHVAGVREQWGCFRISHLAKNPSRQFGAFEASCPFHRRNRMTGCKKMCRLTSEDPAHIELGKMVIKNWCSMAQGFDRQRHHMVQPLEWDMLPASAVIESRCVDRGPDEDVLDDEDLDDIQGIAGGGAPPPSPDGAAGRGRQRGRGGRGRGARGRAGRGRGMAASGSGGPVEPADGGGPQVDSDSVSDDAGDSGDAASSSSSSDSDSD